MVLLNAYLSSKQLFREHQRPHETMTGVAVPMSCSQTTKQLTPWLILQLKNREIHILTLQVRKILIYNLHNSEESIIISAEILCIIII